MRYVGQLCVTVAAAGCLLLGACRSEVRPPSSRLAEMCDLAVRRMDLSQFREFHLDTRHIDFDLLDYNVVDSASVVREDDGRYRFSVAALVEGRCGEDECIWQEYGAFGCPILSTPPDRYLDSQEVEWLQDAFTRLNVCPDSTEYCTGAGPYIVQIVTLRWDDFSASDDPCDGIPTLYYTQVSDILWELWFRYHQSEYVAMVEAGEL